MFVREIPRKNQGPGPCPSLISLLLRGFCDLYSWHQTAGGPVITDWDQSSFFGEYAESYYTRHIKKARQFRIDNLNAENR